MDRRADERTITLTPSEAGERLGVRAATLRNMRARGDGPPFVRVGGRVRYRVVDLAEWLERAVRTSTVKEHGRGEE